MSGIEGAPAPAPTPTAPTAPSGNTGGIPAGEAQGLIPMRMSPTGNESVAPPGSSNAKTDTPYPIGENGRAAMIKWFGNQVKTAEEVRVEALAANSARVAEQQAEVIAGAGTAPSPTTIPVTDGTPAPLDVYANTADQPSAELLELARSFAPVLEQFKQQGYNSAEALTQAQSDANAKAQLESQQAQLFQQYEAAVDNPDNPLDPAIAERLFLAEARAMQATHQANQLMAKATAQANAAMVHQVKQQFPNLPAETITQVMTALPGEAGANMLASISRQFDSLLQTEITKQTAAQSARQAQAPAKAAGAASSTPPAAQGGQQRQGPFSWINHFAGQGLRLPNT